MLDQVDDVDGPDASILVVVVVRECDLEILIALCRADAFDHEQEPDKVDVMHFLAAGRLNEQVVEADGYLLAVNVEYVLESSDAALLVHDDGEGVVLAVLWNSAKRVECPIDTQQVFNTKEFTESEQQLGSLARDELMRLGNLHGLLALRRLARCCLFLDLSLHEYSLVLHVGDLVVK